MRRGKREVFLKVFVELLLLLRIEKGQFIRNECAAKKFTTFVVLKGDHPYDLGSPQHSNAVSSSSSSQSAAGLSENVPLWH